MLDIGKIQVVFSQEAEIKEMDYKKLKPEKTFLSMLQRS